MKTPVLMKTPGNMGLNWVVAKPIRLTLCTFATYRYWPESEKLDRIYLEFHSSKTKDCVEVQLQEQAEAGITRIYWRCSNETLPQWWRSFYVDMAEWLKVKLVINKRAAVWYVTCHAEDGKRLVLINEFSVFHPFDKRKTEDNDESAE